MKKLLSMLLAVAMVATLALTALPATAAEIPEISIDSEIKIDEYYGWTNIETIGNENGEIIETVEWTEYNYDKGFLDATVDGTKYESITLDELTNIVSDLLGTTVLCSYGAVYQTYDSPWNVGESYTVLFGLVDTDGNYIMEETEVVFTVCETNIQSVKPETETYTYYEHEYNKIRSNKPNVIITYKDATTSTETLYSIDWPQEPGTYTLTVPVGGTGLFSVNIEVSVLATPTSGQCGETMTWSYDEETGTLTISGTGEMYTIADTWNDFESGNYGYEPEWWELNVQSIVVEEGIKTLSNFAFFFNGDTPENIQLPTTLTGLPELALLYSTNINSLVVPDGITSLTGFPFSYGTMTDLYLPDTLEEADAFSIVTAGLSDGDISTLTLKTIHFAGTEEQWNAIIWTDSEVLKEVFADNYETMYSDFIKPIAAMISQIEVVFESIEVEEKITVDNGTATIPDSTVEITEGEDVVIDLTETEEAVESIVLDAATVEKIAAAETAVEIALPEATVSFDAAAVAAISDAAEGETVTLVVSAVEESTLTDTQQKALAEENVCAVLTLEAYAGETLVTDFKGGVVTVTVPFEAAEGKTYTVAYIADDGTMTLMPTTYADGCLSFTTTHFSDYVVLESATVTPPVSDNPQTGDNGIMLFALLMVVSAAALVVCTAKRKAY